MYVLFYKQFMIIHNVNYCIPQFDWNKLQP